MSGDKQITARFVQDIIPIVGSEILQAAPEVVPPTPEVIVKTPVVVPQDAPVLPKTAGVPMGLIMLLGGLLSANGFMLKRKK